MIIEIWVRRNHLWGNDDEVYYFGEIIVGIYDDRLLINIVKSAIIHNLWNGKLFFVEVVLGN